MRLYVDGVEVIRAQRITSNLPARYVDAHGGAYLVDYADGASDLVFGDEFGVA